MICQICGEECPENSRFCLYCGSPLSQELPAQPAAANIENSVPSEPEVPFCASETIEQASALQYAENLISWEPAPQPKKHPYFVPILIMSVLFATGLFLFFIHPFSDIPNVYTEGCFSIEDGYLTFLPEQYSGGSTLVIPEAIGGQTVIGISAGCFAHNMELQTVILPSKLQVIEKDAFYGCLNLRGIYLPDHVRFLDSRAFGHCSSLEAIVIPESIEEIAPDCFDRCDSLHYVFYGGIHAEWTTIYPNFISIFTYISCKDGIFRQITG